MDYLIKKHPSLKSESGMALMVIMLLVVLVTAVIMMALNVTGIESNLASTNRRTTQGFHAGESGNSVGSQVLQDALEFNRVPTYSTGVTVDSSTAGGDPRLEDFLEELNSGLGSSSDSAAVNPDVVITSIGGHTVNVDVDYEGYASLPGSELEEFAIGYHKKVGGTGCGSGTLYYVDSEARGPMNTKAQVSSSYFGC